MARTPIEDSWKEYALIAIPADAGETQRVETRQAFFAGVAVMFTAVVGLSDNEEKAQLMLSDVQKEIDSFGHALDQKVFKMKTH